MTTLGLFLVLTAAVCHATWNFFVKRINAGPELVWLFSAISVVLYFPLALWIGWGVARFGPTELFFYAGTVVLHLCYFLLLQVGYRKGDLSLVYPTARSTGPLLSSCFAVLILGEQITFQIAVGGLTIIFGVLMLTGGFRRGRGRKAMVSLGFGLLVGMFIGTYTVFDAYAVSVVMIPPLLLDYASGLGRATLLAPIAWRRREKVRAIWAEHWWRVIFIAIFNALAYILVLYAMTFTPVVFVAPLRELSVLLAVLMGSLLLGEGDLGRRLGWAVVILTGVVTLVTA